MQTIRRRGTFSLGLIAGGALWLILAPAAQAKNILLVTDNGWRNTRATTSPGRTPEADFVQFLSGTLGHTVIVSTGVDGTAQFRNGNNGPPTAAQLAPGGLHPDGIDLIVVSRTTDSGQYSNATTRPLWNAIQTPMLLMAPHISRGTTSGNSRWRWVNSDNATSAVRPLDLDPFPNPNHPFVQGLGPVGFMNPAGRLTTTMNHTTAVGNGTIVATHGGADRPAIVEWAPGVEFYPGAGEVPGGRRVLFAGLPYHEDHNGGPVWFSDFGLGAQRLLCQTIGNLAGGPTNHCASLSLPPFPTLPADAPRGGVGTMGIREVINNGLVRSNPEAIASLQSGQGTIVDYQAPVLHIYDSGVGGVFRTQISPRSFGVVQQGHVSQGAAIEVALMAQGTIRIPAGEGGIWTFGVNSDDSFRLLLPGQEFLSATNGIAESWQEGTSIGAPANLAGRAAASTLGRITLTEGDHPFVLVYHQGTGGASVELFAARGSHTAVPTQLAISPFRLVGHKALATPLTAAVPGMVPSDFGVEPPAGQQPQLWNFKFENANVSGMQVDQSYRQMVDIIEGNMNFLPVGVTITRTLDYANYVFHHEPGGTQGTATPGFTSLPIPGSVDGGGVRQDDYVTRITGTLDMPADGDVILWIRHDDGFSLQIENANFTQLGGAAYPVAGRTDLIHRTGSVTTQPIVATLPAGQHAFTLMQVERGGSAIIQLAVDGAPDAGGWLLGTRPASLVQVSDFDGLQLVSSGLAGDMDNNGVVDRRDVVMFARNYNLTDNPAAADGDFNGDNAVGLGDLLLMQKNLGSPPAPAFSAAAVPEPSSAMLLAAGVLGWLTLRRRRPALRRA